MAFGETLANMRWTTLLFVIVHLLLRGAAVPHSHAAEEGFPEHEARIHVHLSTPCDHHGDEHHHSPADDDRHGRCPSHGSDAVFLDSDIVVPHTADSVEAEDVLAMTSIVPPAPVCVAPGGGTSAFMRARPPGDMADFFHEFLPHVLRI